MASPTATLSFGFRLLPSPTRLPRTSVRFSYLNPNPFSLQFGFSHSVSGFPSSFSFPHKTRKITPIQKPRSLVVVAAKGYKLKTHKASAKRFRVTGSGKIVRRSSGKQHLQAKKGKKRKLRLSKMHPVNRSDYDNVIRALPYLKVNRNAK